MVAHASALHAPSGDPATTNRPGSGAVLAAQGEQGALVGIDTITVFGPVREIPLEHHYARVTTNPETGVMSMSPTSTRVDLPSGTQVAVRMQQGQATAFITQSIPTQLHGNNVVAASLEKVWHGVERLYGLSSEYLNWMVSISDLGVSRLDLVRDFPGVPLVPVFITNLSRLPAPRCLSSRCYTDPQDGAVQSLVRGRAQRWQATLYDKQAQVLHLASRAGDDWERDRLLLAAAQALGQIRYEVSLKRPVLHEKGIHTMKDITHDAMDDLARSHFHRSGFDVPVHTAGHLNVVLATKAQTEKAKTICGVLGYLATEALGLAWHGDPRTRRNYAKIAQEWDLNPADWPPSHGQAAALEFDLGALA